MQVSDWIGVVGTIISVISMGVAGWSAYVAHQQWQKIEKKVGYITDAAEASAILPAWYTGRMMSDNWVFGLLLDNNKVAVIECIVGITDDGKWMDVELHTEGFSHLPKDFDYMYAITEERNKATIQVSRIISAFELIES